uniref:Solute carrier organic anion transporter family member 4A1 n=1 Tax=Panagrolaimus sp. PS1159 TaxID=55785 RepID=A0AC35GRW3_9BILA
MWIFLVLLFFSVVASFASGIPSQQIMLRVIPFQQRTLGIGVHWTFLRLLGFIPGGVLFGLMIDTTCLKWKESKCGSKQSCLVYDPELLSWTIMGVGNNIFITAFKIFKII